MSWAELGTNDRKAMSALYDERIFPVLTPLAVDPGHPFPYISNLALSIAANVADPETGERRFVRLKVPNVFPRLVALDEGRYLPAEELIAAHLSTLFVGMIVEEWAVFRVTRNADLTLEDEEADDLLEAVEFELRRRRFNNPVRLEVQDGIGGEVLDLLVRELEIDPGNVSRHRAMLDLSCLMQLHVARAPRPQGPPVAADHGRPHRRRRGDRSADRVGGARSGVAPAPSVRELRQQRRGVHRPGRRRPARAEHQDDAVSRGGDSAIIRSLIRASERGVQVAVLVELKARFDEATNVQWAKQLERAGVHVVYGMVGLKTHCKVALVVRDDGDQLRRYTHISTGNYNSRTARLYEDLGYITCDNDIGADATQLFNHLTGYSRSEEYRTLLVAPRDLRRQLLDLIEHEAGFGAEGHIVFKCNSIADRTMMDALYEASAAGTRINLIARGICCVRAGVPGLSETIEVRSLLGRYLEHSRIYRFAHGDDGGGPIHLIGSADLMPRNLDRRVEVLVPIVHPKHREWLDQALDFALADDVVRWELQPDNEWIRVGPPDAFDPNAQDRMYRWAAERQQAMPTALR